MNSIIGCMQIQLTFHFAVGWLAGWLALSRLHRFRFGASASAECERAHSLRASVATKVGRPTFAREMTQRLEESQRKFPSMRPVFLSLSPSHCLAKVGRQQTAKTWQLRHNFACSSSNCNFCFRSKTAATHKKTLAACDLS